MKIKHTRHAIQIDLKLIQYWIDEGFVSEDADLKYQNKLAHYLEACSYEMKHSSVDDTELYPILLTIIVYSCNRGDDGLIKINANTFTNHVRTAYAIHQLQTTSCGNQAMDVAVFVVDYHKRTLPTLLKQHGIKI